MSDTDALTLATQAVAAELAAVAGSVKLAPPMQGVAENVARAALEAAGALAAGPQPGDTIGLPDEPPVGSRLRIAGIETVAPGASHLELVHQPEGWYYAGFLGEDGTPHDPKTRGWGWDYVISTHKRLVYVEVGTG